MEKIIILISLYLLASMLVSLIVTYTVSVFRHKQGVIRKKYFLENSMRVALIYIVLYVIFMLLCALYYNDRYNTSVNTNNVRKNKTSKLLKQVKHDTVDILIYTVKVGRD